MLTRVIGTCGTIACGKSARVHKIAAWWAQEGKLVYPSVDLETADADKIAHRCYAPGSDCYFKVVQHFSKDILVTNDNNNSDHAEIDRKKLGALVFGTGKMPELNKIVWPEIAKTMQSDIATSAAASKKLNHSLVYLVEAAVLPHMPEMLQACHEVWMFHANKEVSTHRLMKRNNLSEEEANKRILSQSSLEEKKALILAAKKELKLFDTSFAESQEQFQQSLEEAVVEFRKVLDQVVVDSAK